jgi:hypothetical protein
MAARTRRKWVKISKLLVSCLHDDMPRKEERVIDWKSK